MKIAVALSGGGARCAAQLGYLDVILDLGIRIEALSGSSGGSIVAAMLAKGYAPAKALEILEHVDYSQIAWKLRGAIWDLAPMERELHRLGLKSFEDLTLPLYVTLTDFEDLSIRYVDSGDLAKALLASSSLIPLFAPTLFEGRLYIDGGFGDNLPVRPLLGRSMILAINVNPQRAPFPNTLLGNLKRASYALFNSNIRASVPLADHYVQIEECGKYGILARKKLRKIYELGQKAARADLGYWNEHVG